MQINLEEHDINVILAILGDMPSKTGTWPLMMKIKVQADAQLVEPEIKVGGWRQDGSGVHADGVKRLLRLRLSLCGPLYQQFRVKVQPLARIQWIYHPYIQV